MQTIGAKLRAAREARGITPYGLARRAGLSAQAVYDVESGQRPNPRWDTVVALAGVLGLSLDDLAKKPQVITSADA